MRGNDYSLVNQALGQKQGMIASIFESSTYEREIAQLSNGDLLIAIYGGTPLKILLLRVDQRGVIRWDEKTTLIQTQTYGGRVRAFPDVGGGCFISWIETAPDGLFIRHLDSAGSELWTSEVTDEFSLHYDVVVTRDGGLVVANSTTQAVEVFRVQNDGSLGWNGQAVILATNREIHNPVSLALMNDDKEVVAMWYKLGEEGNAFLAQRVRLEDGKRLWDVPVALGPAPIFGGFAPPRKIALKAIDGAFEAFLYKGETGDAIVPRLEEYQVRVALDGEVTVISPPLETEKDHSQLNQ